jgi:hypothetical protein
MGRPKQTRPPKPYPNHDRKFQILHELTPESITLKNLLAIPLLIPIVRSSPVPELLWHSAVLNPPRTPCRGMSFSFCLNCG